MYETSGVSELYGRLRWSSLSDCPRSHSVTSSEDTSVKRWSQSQLTSSYQEEKKTNMLKCYWCHPKFSEQCQNSKKRNQKATALTREVSDSAGWNRNTSQNEM